VEVYSKLYSDREEGLPISRDEEGVREGFPEVLTASPPQASSFFFLGFYLFI